MKYIIIITLFFYANCSSALVIWPGSTAPCNTTLATCANNSPVGEVIEIRTNAVIDESVIAINATSFKAGVGYKPAFAADRYLQVLNTGLIDLTVSVEGLTFLRGAIIYNDTGSSSATTTLNIKNNHIIDNTFAAYAIRIDNRHKLVEANIDFNQVDFNPPSTGLERRGAVSISNGSTSGSSTSGEINGQIYGNTINVMGSESVGIGVYEFSNNTSDLDVSSNQLTGGETGAIYIEKATGSNGSSRLDFAHNAVYSNQIDSNFRGLYAEVSAGELEVNAVNNSVLGAFDGFNFQESAAGEINVEFYNNIVGFTEVPVLLNFYNLADSTITINNDNNLFYDNDLVDPDYVAGPNVINADPKIISLTNARLKFGSPAIEAGSNILLSAVPSVNYVDADGLHRVKKGDTSGGSAAVDVGAYETGDLRVLDSFNNSNTHINSIESPLINAQNNPKLQVTQNWNPTGGSGVFNNSNIGVYDCGVTWCTFNQDFNNMSVGAAFNLWSPASSTQSFVHTAADAAPVGVSYTTINNSGMNNKPSLILSVTQFWNGVYNDHPIGAVYDGFAGRWVIENMNDADMPENAQFNVYSQTPSANAFVHKAVTANTFDSITVIDHPLLNGTPCAQFQVTHVGVVRNPYSTGIYYDGGLNKWAIFNQGGSGDSIAVNNEFHIIVSAEQIAACNGDLIFEDGFE